MGKLFYSPGRYLQIHLQKCSITQNEVHHSNLYTLLSPYGFQQIVDLLRRNSRTFYQLRSWLRAETYVLVVAYSPQASQTLEEILLTLGRQFIVERLLTDMFSPYTSRLHGQDMPRRNRPMRIVAMSEWRHMCTQRNTIPLWLWSRVRRTLVSAQSQRVCLFAMRPWNLRRPARWLPLLLPARSVISCNIIYPLLQASDVLYFTSNMTYHFK